MVAKIRHFVQTLYRHHILKTHKLLILRNNTLPLVRVRVPLSAPNFFFVSSIIFQYNPRNPLLNLDIYHLTAIEHFMMPPQLSEGWLNIFVQPPKDLLEAISVIIISSFYIR